MEKLRLAVQKSGRLSEKSLSLIKECGINIHNSSKRLIATSTNFPIEVLYLRDDDIPGYVADGVADIGIVGENTVVEKRSNVDTAKRLGFSKCRLSIAVPKSSPYNDISDLNGQSIATSYPEILGDYLAKNNVTAELHEISGSVEIAPGIGLADAICDIVSTGSTLISNGLKEVEEIFYSEALLISNKEMSSDKKALLDDLLFRIQAVQTAKDKKYILLNAPNESLSEITALLPGMKSPSIQALAVDGWSSVSTVVNEADFWAVIEKLRSAGAEGILVMPIEKMIL